MKDSIRTFIHDWNIPYALSIWGTWNIALLIVSAVAITRLPAGAAASWSGISEQLNIWTNWDGNNYVMIARDGYAATDALPLHAFFPLLPLLMRGLAWIPGISYPLAGIIISRISTLGAIIFLIKLVQLDFSRTIAYRAAWFLLIFPTSFYFFSVFTESLFLFTTLSAWYFARVGKWWQAGITGFFSPLTRLLGILILPVLLFEYLKSKEWNLSQIKTSIVWTLTPILGIGSWMVYNLIDTGNPLHFIQVQSYWEAHGRGGYQNPLSVILDNLLPVLQSIPEDTYRIVQYFDLWATIFCLGILILITIKKLIPWPYIIWSWIFLTIPIISGSLVSMPRYVLGFFPMYIALALWAKNEYVYKAYELISILLLAVLTSMFIFGHWVA